MKLRSLFLFICILCVTITQAQNKDFKGELYLGVGGGAMFTNMDFSPSVPQQFHLGYSGGLAAKYISEKNLGVILEANVSQRGWKEDYDPATGFEYTRKLNYVEIPFMAHVYAGKKTRFIFNAGPQISILLSDKQQMSEALANDLAARRTANPDARIGEQYMAIDSLKRVDYGIVAGIGMELKTGIGNFDLEGRYYFGFGDTFPNNRGRNDYFQRSAHRIIEAKLTYYFRMW